MTLTPDEQAAVERLREIGQAYWSDRSFSQLKTAAKIVLREHRPDDGEAVTEEFIRSLSCSSYNGCHITSDGDSCREWLVSPLRSNFLRVVFSKDPVYISYCDNNGVAEVSCDGEYDKVWQFRQLCNALGIELEDTE